MNYQILDFEGNEVIASVTEEQLTDLIDSNEYNYFQYDANPEYDLVQRWVGAVEEGQDVSAYRIYKKIEEEVQSEINEE
jgi:hypothetical protein